MKSSFRWHSRSVWLNGADVAENAAKPVHGSGFVFFTSFSFP